MSAQQWRRVRAGRYVCNGIVIEQYQGDRHPRWGIWVDDASVLDDEPWDWAWTLREAKRLASTWKEVLS